MKRADALDAVILGAGAAGMMAAATAGQGGCRVAVLDHAAQPGRKILISGGGRCNFTHLDSGPDMFLSANPHFAKSALARYTPADFLELVKRHRIAWHAKTPGQLFCDRSASEIVGMLVRECQQGNVAMHLSNRIIAVRRDADGIFVVETDRMVLHARAIVLATGGLSIPKLGATGLSHDVARRFGLKIIEPAPALVPLTFGPCDREWMTGLAGVSMEIGAKCHVSQGRRGRDIVFRDGMLFTHRGLSGPAILQASSYWSPGASLDIDCLPGRDAARCLRELKKARPRMGGAAMLASLLPQRLAHLLAARHLPDGPVGEMPDGVLDALAGLLSSWRLMPTGSEGYAKAEVTRGGIDTAGLSSQTMEARDVPGLFAVGEAVDVTGWLGGHNFQWAWSSGHAAGRALAERTQAERRD
ncbi:BaiN/RdsA family NAD(P)/FAD-dependent oxidoreductase [Novacetimonas pomaceti]|nr:NAD(P)/FAD-dependent oxidoreductase [Novacetimonas pomaceti]